MDRGAWWAAVHGVVKSRARLSNFTFIFMTPVKEKGKCISGNNQLLKKKECQICVMKDFVFLGGRRVPRTWRLRGLCGQHRPTPHNLLSPSSLLLGNPSFLIHWKPEGRKSRQVIHPAHSLLFLFNGSVVSDCLEPHGPPDLPVHHQLPESTQTHVHRVGDAIQPSHPLPSPSPPAFNLSQHLGLFQ